MVRPPAIYGPGDMEMRDLFRLARWGIALLPPPGKLSVIEVSDLARLLLALVDGRSNRRLLEADDGTPGGWIPDQLANAIRRAVERKSGGQGKGGAVRVAHGGRPINKKTKKT